MLIYGKDNRAITKYGKWSARTVDDEVILRLEMKGWITDGVIKKERVINSNRKLRQVIVKMIASCPIK